MHLLYSNPIPSPEFVSLSLLTKPDSEEPTSLDGGGMGQEPLLLASPLSTISYTSAIGTLKELHKYLTALTTLDVVHSNSNATIYDRIVADLLADDENYILTPPQQQQQNNSSNNNNNNKIQIYRPFGGNGIGLHYRLLQEEKVKNDFASLILASSRGITGDVNNNPQNNNNQNRKIEKNILGVLICVGISGLPYAHYGSSALQYGLTQRIHDCVGLLHKRMLSTGGGGVGTIDVSAAKTILSTLLANEDEVRKTNEVAESTNRTALPTINDSSSSGGGGGLAVGASALKNLVNLNKGNDGTGGGNNNIHVAMGSLSNDRARVLIERLNVLSVADDDSLLRPYETSGQQRKANLDLTGNKSRFRKRKMTDSSNNPDLDLFDYKGPTKNQNQHSKGQPNNRLLKNHFHNQQQFRGGGGGTGFGSGSSTADNAFQASFGSSVSSPSFGGSGSSGKSSSMTSSSKGGIRQHKSDAQHPRRNRAVPTLSAPRADVSNNSHSRRSSANSFRYEDGAEDDARSRRSGKSYGGSSRQTTEDMMSETSRSMTSGNLARIQVNIALNEDLTCSYKFSKMTSCSVEGVIQVQVKSNARAVVPFQLLVRDPSKHIQTLQENRKFAEDSSTSLLSRDMLERGDRGFTIGVPRADNYFPLIRYKCSSELRPVPIRVQTRVKVDGGYCRVALQISSNPHNEGSLTDLTIIMGVANDIRGESLVTQPAGGVWNASKRSVIWCVSELGDGEKFQLQARFEMDKEAVAAAAKDEQDTPKFPVLVRCQCMYAQLSDVEVAVQDIPEIQPAEVAMKVARRFRLSHQERS